MPIRAAIAREIERRRADILDLSRRIHADPELAFEEVRTSRPLRSVLAAEGFVVPAGRPPCRPSFRAVSRVRRRPAARDVHGRDGRPARTRARLRPQHHRHGRDLRRHRPEVRPRPGGRRARSRSSATPAEERGSGKVRMIQDGVFARIRRRPPDPSPHARHGHLPGPGPAHARRRVLRQKGPRRGRAPRGPERPRRPRPLLPLGRPAPDEVPGRDALPRHHRVGRRSAEHHPRLRPRPVLASRGHDVQARAPRRRGQVPRREGRRGHRLPGQDQRTRARASRPSAATASSRRSSPGCSRSGAGPTRPSSGNPTARPTWPMSPGSCRRSSP